MRRIAIATLVLAGLISLARSGAADPPAERLFPPPSAERAAALLKEIEFPTDPTCFDAMPPTGPREDMQVLVGEREYRRASEWLEELSDATTPIDADLLRMARKGATFDARCRAARVLSLRRHPEAPGILAALVRSEQPAERYVAWSLCRDHAEATSTAPIPPAIALERLATEAVPTIVDRILQYLGTINAREAIPLFLDWTRTGRHGIYAVEALGVMRVPEAVPVILTSKAVHGTLMALGRIGTREAVDYILAHLDSDAAVYALAESHDPRGLPAVEAELARLRALPPGERRRFQEREAQIARIRLASTDPVSALLDLAEDVTADIELRRDAVVRARQDYPSASSEARLVHIYAREGDPVILEQCWMALRSSRAPGVTEAMLHHAQVWKPYRKTTDPVPLVRAINRRLGTTYGSLDDVRALATARGIR